MKSRITNQDAILNGIKTYIINHFDRAKQAFTSNDDTRLPGYEDPSSEKVPSTEEIRKLTNIFLIKAASNIVMDENNIIWTIDCSKNNMLVTNSMITDTFFEVCRELGLSTSGLSSLHSMLTIIKRTNSVTIKF